MPYKFSQGYVVGNTYFSLHNVGNFLLLLFFGMVLYTNEVETKEK